MVATPPMPTMSASQVAAVQGDWSAIKGKSTDIFYFFLTKFPNNYSHFKSFSSKDIETAKGTPEFASQAKDIIDFLTNVIDKVGSDVAGAKGLLNKLAAGHKTMGIKKEQFEDFRLALIELLGKLGYGANLAAWNLTMDMVFHIIYNNLDGHPV